MRIVLALAVVIALAGRPRPLDKYLQLTREQWDSVAMNGYAFNDSVHDAQRRQYELETEVQRETNAEPLSPAALDVRIAEFVRLHRRIEAQRTKMIAENVAVLTAVQRQKLVALADVPRLVSLAYDARYVGLMDAACVSSPAPPGQQLVSYLQLTVEQATEIVARQRAAALPTARAQKRVFDAFGEFGKAMSAEPLDPQLLGAFSAAREMASRELTSLHKKLSAENQAALSERQKQLLNALSEAEKLSQLLNEAEGTFIARQPQIVSDTINYGSRIPCEFQFQTS